MLFQYSKLKGRIKEICGSDYRFAELMKLSPTTISAKLNNKSEFSQPEIMKAVEILNLEPYEITLYFFTPLV